MQVDAEEALKLPGLPVAPAHEGVRGDDVAGGREQQRPGQVGRGLGQDAGRVDDGAAVGAGLVEVDVVIADRDVGDDLQTRSRGEDLGVDSVAQHTDERIAAPHAFEQERTGHRLVVLVAVDLADGP